MISIHLILAIAGIIAAVGLSFGLAVTVGSYLRYGGKRVVKCPETKQPAAVHINVAKAAREGLFRSPNIRAGSMLAVARASGMRAGMPSRT
jgi:hypothetical protein